MFRRGILALILWGLLSQPSMAYCPKILRVGFVPSENAQELLRKTPPITNWLSKSLKMGIVPFVAPDYAGIVEAMRAGKVDVAFFAPGGFVMAEKQAGAKVILKSVRKGKAFFYSAIITHRDSPIHNLADLRGKSFAFVDPASVSGSLYPKALLLAAGLNPERDFSRVIYAGGHDATVLAVLNRKVDAGATFANDTTGHCGAWTEFLREKREQDQIRVVAYTKPTPSDNICVSKGLDPKLVQRIKRCFLGLWATPKSPKSKPEKELLALRADGRRLLKELYHIDGYVEATSADYQPVREAFERLELKLR